MAEDAPKEESVTEPRAAGRSLDPHEVWEAMQRGDARLLDLRTVLERRRYGAPRGAVPVSLARHVLKPEAEARSTSASTRCARKRPCATAPPR